MEVCNVCFVRRLVLATLTKLTFSFLQRAAPVQGLFGWFGDGVHLERSMQEQAMPTYILLFCVVILLICLFFL